MKVTKNGLWEGVPIQGGKGIYEQIQDTYTIGADPITNNTTLTRSMLEEAVTEIYRENTERQLVFYTSILGYRQYINALREGYTQLINNDES